MECHLGRTSVSAISTLPMTSAYRCTPGASFSHIAGNGNGGSFSPARSEVLSQFMPRCCCGGRVFTLVPWFTYQLAAVQISSGTVSLPKFTNTAT